MKLRLPHPLVLLIACVAMAAALTWIIPAGEFARREDPATGRTLAVAGTYHHVEPAPVDPFAAIVAIPRGFVEAAEVVAVILFVGGAWVVVDTLGTLNRLVGAFVVRFRRRGLLAVPIVSLFFVSMGALENMQEEIIPLVPVLLLLGRRVGIDAVTVVAMSTGAAMIGSAFGPTNPFQAGIALRVAELPPLSGGGVRLILLIAATAIWLGWTMRHAMRTRTAPAAETGDAAATATGTDWLTLTLMLLPMLAYVYGAMAWQWGFNELSAAFTIGGVAAGLIGGLGVGRTVDVFLDGMKTLLPAALVVGVARSISLVLADGRVIDTILHALSQPLGGAPPMGAALAMIPLHAVVHVVVPSVSGQAVLTLPLLVPLSDLLGLSRQVTVLAYQVGAGLTELLTPTNGALMAVLLASGVSFRRWIGFSIGGVLLVALVGVAGMVLLS